jgi:hypothetical protein
MLKWRPPISLFLIILWFSIPAFSQSFTVSGKIADSKGKPIPFATVFVKEISRGLTTGEDGLFSLFLPPGNYTLKIQSIGYKPESKLVKLVDKDISLKINLKDLSYELREVVISGRDNPANRIMRAAIARGAYYKKLLKAYDAEVYVKSGQKLEKISDLVKMFTKKEDEMPKVGQLYLAESFNKVAFRAPDKYTQTVIKSQSFDIPGSGQEIPGIGLLTEDFFQPMVMSAPSPLGRNAFANYNFKLEGISSSDSQAVYKIKVDPKRPGMFFKGYVYIENRNYLLKNIDVELESNFITFFIRMDYQEMYGRLILPASFLVKFKVSILGNDFSGNTNGSIDYKRIEIDSAIYTQSAKPIIGKEQSDSVARSIKTAKEIKLQQDLDKLLSKPEMTMNDMNKFMRIMKKQEKEQKKDSANRLEVKEAVKIQKDTLYNKYDSAFWKQRRPIPLNGEEVAVKGKIDSVYTSWRSRNDTAKRDTIPKNRPYAWYKYPGRFILGGKLWNDSLWEFKTKGFLSGGSYFSPVDGPVVACQLECSGKNGNKNGIILTPMYSFDRQDFMFEGQAWMFYRKAKPSRIILEVFSSSADMNKEHELNKLVNSFSTLILHQNHFKQIHDEGFKLLNIHEVSNGLQFTEGFEYHNYRLLENHSRYSFPYHDSIYPANIPDNHNLVDYPLKDYEYVLLTLAVQFTPENRYRMREGRKINVGSDYPVLRIEARQALPFGTRNKASFTQLRFSVKQIINMGVFTDFRYSVTTGTSLSDKGIQFSEFYHPAVNDLHFSAKSLSNTFFLIPNYTYSTPGAFLDAHTEYESTCIILKRLPFLSKQLLTEKVGISYFSSKDLNHYNEVFYGFSKILFAGEALVVAGFKNAKYTYTGVMFKFGFN